MGRPQLSDAEHFLRGTEREPSQAANTEPTVMAGRPKFPKWLSREARSVMKQLCIDLERRRVLTAGDRDLLAQYATVHVRWLRALVSLEAEGEIVEVTTYGKNGEPLVRMKPNPWLAVAQASEKQMVAIQDRLGLTPLNREKIKPAKQGKPAAVCPFPEDSLGWLEWHQEREGKE